MDLSERNRRRRQSSDLWLANLMRFLRLIPMLWTHRHHHHLFKLLRGTTFRLSSRCRWRLCVFTDVWEFVRSLANIEQSNDSVRLRYQPIQGLGTLQTSLLPCWSQMQKRFETSTRCSHPCLGVCFNIQTAVHYSTQACGKFYLSGKEEFVLILIVLQLHVPAESSRASNIAVLAVMALAKSCSPC